MREVTTPLGPEVESWQAGDRILLSGVIYTARDAAHQRMAQEGMPLPWQGQAVYYAGPSPAPPGRPIGSVGPTTSGRMDAFAPLLMAQGLRAMIGKGERADSVVEAMRKYGCVYLAAIGGAGALLGECVKEAEIAAYPDLGPEAVWRLVVEKMPLVVAIDCQGGNLYQSEPPKYRKGGGC
ncbi:MAG: TRZ/ATZ family protein [Firmicutes bacterium]|jgi:fumarate hydratase subunit beta|nr:TRZ/ATZ family protein [Bacillota bacterium]HQD39951.1 FumA C-terminus/TtdB family hydratase beta subunit [Bacillota bacterium]